MVYPIIICCWLNVSYYSVGKCLHKDYIISLLANIPFTHFMPLISFDTPRKQKQEVFLCFQAASKQISGMKWVNVLHENIEKGEVFRGYRNSILA